MIKTLIRSAIILDPTSAHHGKKRDILIVDRQIVKIAAKIEEKKANDIKTPGLYVSPGWIDLRAHFRDPGEEQKESLQSGAEAARRGGFTRVVLMPSTQPPVDTKTGVEYLNHKASGLPLQLYPTGTLSQKLEGKQLAELFDMHLSGAIAFTDDKQPVSTELMTRSLEYARNFGGLVMSFPFDPGVNPGGMMHEGPTSTGMGIKGLSSLSEEMRLHRDLSLLAYCGGRLHVSLISTSGSVDLIRKAKKNGLAVTCAVAAHQLAFTDEDMIGFDSNLKVLPPFRSKSDRKALIAGLKDGTIDAICSDHSPEDHEHKVLEWEYANYGISSIENTFSIALEQLRDHLEPADLIAKFTSGPASVLGVETARIEEGETAELTAFSLTESTTYALTDRGSKSVNTPFGGKTLIGKIIPVDRSA